MATIYCDSSAADVHEEDRGLVEQLAKLQHMYGQIYQVRKLLPEKLIAPIKQATASQHAHHAISPAALAAQLRKVATEGCGQIQSFKEEWHSEEMRSLWDQANKEWYPQGDDCWRADYEGISKEMKKLTQSANEKMKELEEQQEAVEEDPKVVVGKIKEKHPTLRTNVLDEAVGLPMDLKIGGMSFRIKKEESGPITSYAVTGKPGTKMSGLSQEILRFLENRKDKQSLINLLDLLASYSDVQARPCDKCTKVFDDNMQLAIVKVPRNQEEDNGKGWSSLHPKCA